MPENLLAFDIGTQSIRALLFNPNGQLLYISRIRIEPYFSTAPGFAEQDPEVFWKALCDACQDLWAQGVDKSCIAGISLTTQAATVINLDKYGKPLRPAISWLDQRRVEGVKPVGGLWGASFKIVGASETVAYLQAEAEANWIQYNQPGLWKDTHKYLFLSGYLTFRMTGRYKDSVGCQVGYIPFDYKKQDWEASSGWKWQAVPVERKLLPELVPVASKLGEISKDAAAATGLPAGMTVIAAAHDKATEVLGAGCLEPKIGCLSYGTTATISTTHKKYIEVIPLIPAYPAAVPNQYSLQIGILRGYWMVTWFKKEFGLLEQGLADAQGVEPETFFDDLVRKVPPGSDGLVLQPFWSPGLVFPGPEARGAIIGFSDVTTRAHIYRAILEGLAYALREGGERTTKRSGVPITELRVACGGSQSKAAMQLTADVFGLPASRPHIIEASGLGAAMDAAVGLGIHPDFPTAIRQMTRVRDIFEPEPKTHEHYNELYHGVYKKMYNRLQPLYKVMRPK
jgi:sugar (pentulose or hexulose) kinase